MENAAESTVSQSIGFAAVERMRERICYSFVIHLLLHRYSVCQTEDFYLPFESELSIFVGITSDIHVEGLFSTGLYLPHLFLKNKFYAGIRSLWGMVCKRSCHTCDRS